MSGGQRSQTATQAISRVDDRVDEGSNRVASHTGGDNGDGDRDDDGTTMEQDEPLHNDTRDIAQLFRSLISTIQAEGNNGDDSKGADVRKPDKVLTASIAQSSVLSSRKIDSTSAPTRKYNSDTKKVTFAC
jgi:hypothetical protein